MICTRCNYLPCQCTSAAGLAPQGQTLRVNRCIVQGCEEIVSVGDPEKNLRQGFHHPVKCRWHRDPSFRPPPEPYTMPVIPDEGPIVPFAEVKEEFERLRKAAGESLRAYWQEQGIIVRQKGDAHADRDK